jgi:prevent-host-death family protein
MRVRTWTVAEAKAQFDELIEIARSGEPQIIAWNGRRVAVVVAADQWERKRKRVGNLAEFFAASPLKGSRLRIGRIQDSPRRVDDRA